ncbi:MAG: hypothetical protein J7L07_01290 [Candidatus Odinarchaeota archaeon]|nr:hypothetical protein [Candidatus Odinarchaeota archaeon]
MSIRIMVALENTIFTAGDILKGEVMIASSNIITEILEIIINLKVLENVVLEGKRESYVFYNTNYKIYDRKQLIQTSIDKGLTIPFQIILPYDAPGTYNGHYAKCLWILRVKVILKGNKEIIKEIPFIVLPHPQYIES